MILGPSGPAELYARVLDWHCCGGFYTLPDDSHWTLAPFSCDLRKKRLECRRDDDGQGFVIDSKGMRAIGK